MPKTQTQDLLHRLRAGIADASDGEALGRTSSRDFLSELGALYKLRLQERRRQEKWEVGLARYLRPELGVRSVPQSLVPYLVLVPVFRDCLFVSGEGDTVTGISWVRRLRVMPMRQPFQGLALTSGPGFKLDRTLEGWELKLMKSRKVKLSEDFLRTRGWNFQGLWSAVGSLVGLP